MSMGLDGSCILCGKPMTNALLCGCQKPLCAGGTVLHRDCADCMDIRLSNLEEGQDKLNRRIKEAESLVWNAAIEAAAKECDRRVDELVTQFEVFNVACECSALRLAAQGIRALKKNTNAQT